MNDAIGTSHSGEGRQARPQTGTPPRFWWLKRLGLMSGVVILLMIGTYWATGVWADRRLDDVLEEWARLPVIQPDDTLGTPADLLNPANPAFHVTAAVTGFPALTPEQIGWENEEHSWPPLTQRDVEVIRSYQADLEPRVTALALAREASRERKYQWALGPLSIGTLLPHLNPMRELSNRIGVSMLLAHRDGDIGRVVDLVRLNRTLSEASLLYGKVLICSLVAAGIEGVSNRHLMELAGYEGGGRSREEELALWRSQRSKVRSLIDELLDDSYYRRLAVEGLDGEWLIALGLRDPAPGWGLRFSRNAATAPMLDVNAVDLLELYGQYRHALVDHRTYPARVQAMSRIHVPPEPASVAGVAARSAFHELGLFDLNWPPQFYARLETTAIAAGVALALRLYEADHGRLPASLEEMVPEYLPRVPQDPFDPSGGPMRYVVLDDLPVVYSVGPDGVDDGGSLRNPDGYDRRLAEDYVFPLRYPSHMNHDPLTWLRERQEREAQERSRSTQQVP